MLHRRSTLALPLLGLPALLPSRAAAQAPSWLAQVPEIRFGMISVENERDAVSRLGGMQAWLAARLGTPVRVFRGTDYAGVVEALRNGHAEVAYLGAAAYALAHRVMGDRIEPIFRYVDNSGMEGYHSAILVRADSPHRRIEDLRGKSIGWSDPNSTSGFQVPSHFLRKAGMDPATFFSRTGFAGSHEQNVMAVLNGTFDAGAVAYSNAERNTFQRMEEKGMIQPGQIRQVWLSPLIPNAPLVLRTELPEALRQAMRQAFADFPGAAPDAFHAMSSGARGLAPAKHADYLDIVSIVEENQATRRQRRS